MTSVGSAIRRGCAVVVVALVLGGVVTACAKRPAMTQASAPPPTAVAAPPAPAPQAIAPAAPTPPPAAPAPAAPAPTAVKPPPAQFAENSELGDIYFDFDKSVIRPRDARILQANAEWLKRNPKAIVLIEGHCDERGTNEYNAALGERRADAARAFLAIHGIDAGRITIISYGEERPTCTQRNEGCWAKNRRSHFLTKSE